MYIHVVARIFAENGLSSQEEGIGGGNEGRGGAGESKESEMEGRHKAKAVTHSLTAHFAAVLEAVGSSFAVSE